MAKVNFNDLGAADTNRPTDRDEGGVKFFKLNDGEDALVRIMLDNPDDLDIRTVHKVTLEGYQYGRNVNCIMENGNPSTCPLCASGSKLDQRIYLRMLQYKVEDGNVTITPVIWERSRWDKVFGAQAMADYHAGYGPLSDILVRISRRGSGLATTYNATFGLNVMPNTKSVYRDELYPKDTTLFGDFDVLGVAILNKNYDDLSYFMQNGYFPAQTHAEPAATSAPAYSPALTSAPAYQAQPIDAPAPHYNAPQVNAPTAYAPPVNVATPRTAPQWNTPTATDGGFSRPKRF